MQLTRRCVQARSLLQTVVPLCAVPRPAPLCRTLTSCTARLSSSHAGDEFAGASTPLSLPPAALFVTTRETITGRVIVRDLGLVAASAVRSRNLAVDMWVALTRIFGGEAPDYTVLLNECTEKATQRLEATARAAGATSVVAVRYNSTTVMNRAIIGLHCTVMVSGTAVFDVDEKEFAAGQSHAQTMTGTGATQPGRS